VNRAAGRPGSIDRILRYAGLVGVALLAPVLGGSALAAHTVALSATAFVQMGDKLTAAGETGAGRFGQTVSISADGNTALIGAPFDNSSQGAVWVFTRSNGVWSQLGGKLTGTGETGNGRFGTSVSLSADGKTAVIGGSGDNTNVGAAWVFTRSGSAWSQQGSKLTGAGETGAGSFGTSVSVSSDGSTALVGGSADNTNEGALWVFTRSGSTWTPQGAKLTGTGETASGSLGLSVSLSADGNTALAGAPGDASSEGAVFVFTRTGSTWSQLGGKLTISGGSGSADFGFQVALSGDGSTFVGGGPAGEGGAGDAWVFTRSGSSWSQQGGKLRPSDESGNGTFGLAVATTNDGSTALIGAPGDSTSAGAVWIFTRSGATWSQQGSKLTGPGATGAAHLGFVGIALTPDGTTGLAGGSFDSSSAGAVWAFSSALPTVSSLSPATGPTAGGTQVTINGSGFTGATAVTFGAGTGTLSHVVSDSQITAISPPGVAGAVHVTVTGPTGSSNTTSVDTFTYVGPAPKPVVARIVFATATRHAVPKTKRFKRTLSVRIRVSSPGSVVLTLIRKGNIAVTKTFTTKGGTNNLSAVIAPGAARGTYQLKAAVSAPGLVGKTYTATVPVPKA
jgi:hypothetical protein